MHRCMSFLIVCAWCAETLPRPQAGDVWVMRTILHDWSNEESAQILSALRAAIGATPVTLAIVEVWSRSEGLGFVHLVPDWGCTRGSPS